MTITQPKDRRAVRAVDLFAGFGGFSLGAEQAGAKLVYAANHWPMAVEAHSRNHPHAKHECQDLRQADWTTLPTYDLLLASPACQGHSQASQPKRRVYHNALRATAWAVVDCADVTSPNTILVENVPDFRRWRLYNAWTRALNDLGYELSEHLLRASRYGVPQRRDRLFILGHRGGRLDLDLKPDDNEPAFGPCIEWGEGTWRPVGGSSSKVQERINAGRSRHGRRFLTQHVTGHKGVSLDEPIRTVTCQDQWAVVDGDHYRPLTVRETARAMGFPDHYGWPDGCRRKDAIVGLGNAVPPPLAKRLVGSIIQASA